MVAEDNASWDMVTQMDLWDDRHNNADDGSDQDEYVLVRQEDIVDGIACFMATYLLSLKETKVSVFLLLLISTFLFIEL